MEPEVGGLLEPFDLKFPPPTLSLSFCLAEWFLTYKHLQIYIAEPECNTLLPKHVYDIETFSCLCEKSAQVFKAAVIKSTACEPAAPIPKKLSLLHTHICPATHFLFISHRLNLAPCSRAGNSLVFSHT